MVLLYLEDQDYRNVDWSARSHGVAFQRPAAPPPIVSGTKTGTLPMVTVEIHSGNETFALSNG